MTESKLDLAALQALADAATEGPWHWHAYGRGGQTLAFQPPPLGEHVFPGGFTLPFNVHEMNVLKTTDDWPPTTGDAAFIAAAREAVPALIAELREARAVIERVGQILTGCTISPSVRAEAVFAILATYDQKEN